MYKYVPCFEDGTMISKEEQTILLSLELDPPFTPQKLANIVEASTCHNKKETFRQMKGG
jgi:hypothetical protein